MRTPFMRRRTQLQERLAASRESNGQLVENKNDLASLGLDPEKPVVIQKTPPAPTSPKQLGPAKTRRSDLVLPTNNRQPK